MRVLVIEDRPETVSATLRALEKEGHEVVLAASTVEARRCLNEREFELVLLDQLLPVEVGGAEASQMEVDALAAAIVRGDFDANGPLDIVWVSAHVVEDSRMAMQGVLGRVPKLTAAREVVKTFRELGVSPAQRAGAGPSDVVVVFQRGRNGAVIARVTAWRPDEEFAIPLDRLPRRITLALRANRGRRISCAARANLRADTPLELDLEDFRVLPQSRRKSDLELWDG